MKQATNICALALPINKTRNTKHILRLRKHLYFPAFPWINQRWLGTRSPQQLVALRLAWFSLPPAARGSQKFAISSFFFYFLKYFIQHTRMTATEKSKQFNDTKWFKLVSALFFSVV